MLRLRFSIFAAFFIFSVVENNFVSAAFGDDISTDNEDNRFSDMGQVTKDVFEVEDGNVELVLNVQDTDTIDEIWILDFEPYRYNLDAMPVDENGQLVTENTGECSSVFESVNWTFLGDSYFQNKTAAQLGTKNLFTSFTRGQSLDAENRRNNKITFEGTMDDFFDCKESDGVTSIWKQTSNASDDEIEYRATLYTTNVRPKNTADSTAGISFVQSHIELIWRLSRQAIANVIISSTAVVQPVILFARVSAVYDHLGDPIISKTNLHVRFRTFVDSDIQMLVYRANGVTYVPENEDHGVNRYRLEPPTTFAETQDCVFALDVGTQTQWQCQQTWDFKFVLDIDTAGHVDNRVPIDASGTFEFLFDLYSCEKTQNTLDRATCVPPVDGTPTQLSTIITIQTTVFVQDAEDDEIVIILVSMKGANDDPLNVPGARGVVHREDVVLQVKFSPALLREDYKLDLELFMVCKGEHYANESYPQGCLQAPTADRYVAHRETHFTLVIPGEGGDPDVTYDYDDVKDDFYQPLSSEQYIETDSETLQPLSVPIHESAFTNVALSAESLTYTITNVYRLVSKTERRRRGVDEDKMVLAKHVVQAGVITASSVETYNIARRYRRDIKDSLRETHGTKLAYGSLGCPEKAHHDADKYDCICPDDSVYSVEHFDCVPFHEIEVNDILVDEETESDGEDEAENMTNDLTENSSAPPGAYSNLLTLITIAFCLFLF